MYCHQNHSSSMLPARTLVGGQTLLVAPSWLLPQMLLVSAAGIE
jgi:hypothetical protein